MQEEKGKAAKIVLQPSHFLSVSVIIATYNRPDRLEFLLKDLGCQKTPPAHEVIVCDDGSNQPSFKKIRKLCAKHNAVLLRQDDEGFRAATARNLGMYEASNDLLVFLDDDLRILPDFLYHHAGFHSRLNTETALIGPRLYVSPQDMQADHPLPSKLTGKLPDEREERYALSFRRSALHCARAPWKVFYTCNASVPRKRLLRIGGFDESFRGWGLEDNELAYRLFKSGISFACFDQSPVFHARNENSLDPKKIALKGLQSDFTSYIANAEYFIQKHTSDRQVSGILNQALTPINNYLNNADPSPWNDYKINIW